MSPQEPWKKKVDLLRKRFGSREDVFCVRRVFRRTEGTEVVEEATFSPQYLEGSETQYQPLTDEWLRKHVYGDKELVLYLLRHDGIKFGACDFDYGQPFDDAKLVRDFSVGLGVPCYISRSTKKGYHLYWFFSQPVQAHLFTSFIHYIYGKVGFHARYLENSKLTIPETFPKQTKFADGKLGNGIKIPMIEPMMKQGRNCWVADDATPLPFEQQWEYLHQCKEIDPKRFEEVLEANEIEVKFAPVSRSSSAIERAYREVPSAQSADPVKQRGDFWSVIKQCAALRQFWEKDEGGRYKIPSNASGDHFHRTASIALARATTNGVEICRQRWSGTEFEKELAYAEETNQHPWTCSAMQDQGLCRVGVHPIHEDHCMKKTPPGVMTPTGYVVNPDKIPEEGWKEPSPIRFATGYMTYEQITQDLTELFSFRGKEGAKEPANLSEQLHELLRAGEKLRSDEKTKLGEYIKAHKLVTQKELKEVKKQVVREMKQEQHQEKTAGKPTYHFHGVTYYQDDGKYWMTTFDKQGIPNTIDITNFTIEITEELVMIRNLDDEEHKNEDAKQHRWFKGVIHIEEYNIHSVFKTPSIDWIRSPESFFTFITNQVGSAARYFRGDYDHIRVCASEFSKLGIVTRKKVEDFGHYKHKGGYKYVTPSVIVTKDEIKPNHELELRFGDEFSQPLDFKIIDEDQFKDLALHILNDYFECHVQVATMTTFAQAMAASILSHLPLQKSPVLWLDGSYGGGKSFVAEQAQFFYGNFTNLVGMNTTGVGKLLVAHNYRDALLVIDDYKESIEISATQIIKLIQAAYDRSGRGAGRPDGTLREKSSRVRGLLTITGENYPMHEASAISRMLIISVTEHGKNVEKGEKVKERRKDYCGFTPYFVQFVYNMDPIEVKAIYRSYLLMFEKKGNEGNENNFRASENMAFNMTAFRLAMDLLVSRGVIPVQKHTELCARQVKNLEIIRSTVVSGSVAQRGSAIFLDGIKELLQDPAHYHLTNYGTFDPLEHRNSKALGFFKDSTPEVIYLYVRTTLGEVDVFLRKSKSYTQTREHIARQLFEEGHIPPGMYDTKSSSYTKQITTPAGNRAYCWAVKIESLGFPPPKGTPPTPQAATTGTLEIPVAKIAASK